MESVAVSSNEEAVSKQGTDGTPSTGQKLRSGYSSCKNGYTERHWKRTLSGYTACNDSLLVPGRPNCLQCGVSHRTTGGRRRQVWTAPSRSHKDERLSLANNLTLPKKAPPARRVWIDKPNSQDKRPLGIPTIKDRAAQALVKMALEPEWEAKFEPNSYGFRPGRNANDAIQAIFLSANKRLWVLDADIRGCFDNIDHACLLSKLGT